MKKEDINVFEVEVTICLGCYCYGGAVAETGYATLELTDEELKSLIGLINESGTDDVKEMKLKEKLPEIYGKLDNAYREAALDAEEYHWLEYGWENSDVFSPYDHIEFGEKELGYKFEYDESEFLDEDGNLDEDYLEDAKEQDFREWLDNYKDSLSRKESMEFMRRFIDVDVQGEPYEVLIPEEIIDMCDLNKFQIMEKHIYHSANTFRLILIERDDGKRSKKSIKTHEVKKQMA